MVLNKNGIHILRLSQGQKYTGGTRKPLANIDECYALLMQGNKNRHVRPTKMNSQSSRSHAIFKIHVCSKTKNANDDDFVTVSCMNIVDLAGSEGVRRTGHQGLAMSEGVHINQGLLCIGKVLQALTNGSKVIPYRDSVLSSVLQDSLNSNSYLTLLACISPHREDMSETLSTLRFAQNAKQLKITPEINNIKADMKKNVKHKQTPYKINTLQVNNVNTIPQKHISNKTQKTQVKSTIKSNTFCTPNKQRKEIKVFNKTVMATKYDRQKLSNIAMNLPRMTQFESTHNRESVFNRTIDSNGSVLSLNMSTSTAFEGNSQKRNINLSPIVRKCVAELKTDLEDNITKLFQTNYHAYISQTPASELNNVGLPATIREELKNIMKEVLYERDLLSKDINEDNNTTSLKTDARCQLFNSGSELFKVPEIPSVVNRPKTSSPIKNTVNATTISTSFTHDALDSDQTVLNKSVRRSVRISGMFQHDQSLHANGILLQRDNQILRRSSRKSVLQMYKNKRRSIQLAASLGSSTVEKHETTVTSSKSVKKSNKTAKKNILNNATIDGSVDGSAPNKEKNLTKHRKAILDLLNKGSISDLKLLPQIGQKTAYQIVTYRTLNGKFKSFVHIENLPIWRGNSWERFAQANMLI